MTTVTVTTNQTSTSVHGASFEGEVVLDRWGREGLVISIDDAETAIHWEETSWSDSYIAVYDREPADRLAAA